ncbi:MAG: hypothetical protein RI907_1060 [Pseudomonadota bacterium]|jgi:hypothetical protein
MITYEKSNRLTFVAAAVALGVAVAAGVWWMQGGQEPSQDGAPAAANASKGVTDWFKGGAGSDEVHTALHPKYADDGRPEDVDEGDWKALNTGLSKAGLDAKQSQRILSFLRFQHSFEAWQNLDETKEQDRRRRMGEALLAEIPDRVKSGEITAVEANLIGAVMIAGLEPDDQSRTKRMETWQGSISSIAAMPTDERTLQEQFKKTEHDRQVAAAYDDWQKRDPADTDRTQAKLEQALVEVKRAINAGNQ